MVDAQGNGSHRVKPYSHGSDLALGDGCATPPERVLAASTSVAAYPHLALRAGHSDKVGRRAQADASQHAGSRMIILPQECYINAGEDEVQQ